ncbi:MAG: hypothetical protein WC836_02230 [Desulfobacula sp.]|jgi:hypothetical protein
MTGKVWVWVWIGMIFLFTVSASQAADSVLSKPKKSILDTGRQSPGSVPETKGNTQAVPMGKASVSILKADIQAQGYTIEIRNDAKVSYGPFIVQVTRGISDRSVPVPAGEASVPMMVAGTTAQVKIDQPKGWNRGYSLLTVEVKEQLSGLGAVVGRRSFSIPQL